MVAQLITDNRARVYANPTTTYAMSQQSMQPMGMGNNYPPQSQMGYGPPMQHNPYMMQQHGFPPQGGFSSPMMMNGMPPRGFPGTMGMPPQGGYMPGMNGGPMGGMVSS